MAELEFRTLAELAAQPVAPRDWGPWRLEIYGDEDPDPVLLHAVTGYEVSLRECQTSAEVLIGSSS